MAFAFAILLATVLAALAGLHLYWALGGTWGSEAVVPTRPEDSADEKTGGQPVFTPGPGATVVVAVLLLVAALVALGAAGVVTLPVPRVLIRFGIWALAAIFLLRSIGDFRYAGFFKRVRGTRFAELDTRLYSPLCLILSALAFIVALVSA